MINEEILKCLCNTHRSLCSLEELFSIPSKNYIYQIKFNSNQYIDILTDIEKRLQLISKSIESDIYPITEIKNQAIRYITDYSHSIKNAIREINDRPEQDPTPYITYFYKGIIDSQDNLKETYYIMSTKYLLIHKTDRESKKNIFHKKVFTYKPTEDGGNFCLISAKYISSNRNNIGNIEEASKGSFVGAEKEGCYLIFQPNKIKTRIRIFPIGNGGAYLDDIHRLALKGSARLLGVVLDNKFQNNIPIDIEFKVEPENNQEKKI